MAMAMHSPVRQFASSPARHLAARHSMYVRSDVCLKCMPLILHHPSTSLNPPQRLDCH